MAERRMLAKSIILSDRYLDLSPLSRCLYVALSVQADDDGFVNNPKSIMRQCGASNEHMEELIHAEFIIQFDSGVVVIKDWFICNHIRRDRYTATQFSAERAQLKLNENSSYSLVDNWEPDGNQNGTNWDAQDRVDQASKDQTSRDQVRAGQDAANISSDSNETYGSYRNVRLTDEEYAALRSEFPLDYTSRIDRLSVYMASSGKSYRNHCSTIRAWAKRDAAKQASTCNCFQDMLAEVTHE